VPEAMTSGLPVMASDLRVPARGRRDAVLYYDACSTPAIADALRAVATEPERLERLSAGGLRRAPIFSWRRLAEETLEIF